MSSHSPTFDEHDAWNETVAALSNPSHEVKTYRHPSGVVGQDMGSHLSVYGRHAVTGDNNVLLLRMPYPPDRTDDPLDSIQTLHRAVKALTEAGVLRTPPRT